MQPGLLVIVSAPSGAGKSSLVNAVLVRDSGLRLSVSHTTRAPRPGEADGREYFFVDEPRFRAMLAAGDFLEHAAVHGNLYGTSQREIASARDAGYDLILEIDWQGASQVRKFFSDAVSVFILPPSIAELERRLRARKQDSDATIARRVAAAAAEIAHAPDFEYVIINNDFDAAAADLTAVIRTARLRTARQRMRYPELFEPQR